MQKRNPAVPFILVTVLLDMLGIGLIVPVLPTLVTSMAGDNLSRGSLIYGIFIASYALMQFVFAPILGALSDAYGRRPVILISLAGSGVDYLLMAFAPNLGWLFVGRILAGISGANITAANAYIADVTPPEDRAKSFGMIGACFGIGFIFGPALGGVLASYGLRLPFLATAVLTLCNALYGYFVLPESHPRERRRPFSIQHGNTFSSLTVLRAHPNVARLIGVVALERLAHDALPSTWVLYTRYRFHWSEMDNGLSLALAGVMFVVVSGFLTGRIVGLLGERKALILALSVGAMTFLAYGTASKGWMMYAAIVLGSIGGIAMPALQSLITQLTPQTEQGAVQGAIAGIQSLAAVASPLLATNLFGYFTSKSAPLSLPGAAFIASGILVAIGAVIAFVNAKKPLLHYQS